MRERRREGGRGSEQNILCVFSAFIGGTLITVRVKLNMREISRAAGVGGEGGCGGGVVGKEGADGGAIKRRQGLRRAFKS